MKTLLSLISFAIVGAVLLPSTSQANCVATGTIPRVFVNGNSSANVGVRDNGANTTFFNFIASGQAFVNAALVAEASHVTVQVTGNAPSCPAPSNGLSQGGTILTILVSP